MTGDPAFTPSALDYHVATRQAAAIEAMNIQMVPVWELPSAFVEISPPVVLFVRGDTAALQASAVAIVGSRAASVDAAMWAKGVAIDAAKRGEIVVSGGARGIDAAAHLGALEAGGRTVAYLGVAADRIYPAYHRALFARILKRGGALVSEYAPGEQTAPYAHSRRNRFIAAHGTPLIVAEAAAGSGTLTTVRYAQRLGRPVQVSPPGVGTMRAGLTPLIEGGLAEVLSD